MLRNHNGVDARPYGKELKASSLRLENGGTWMAYNHTAYRQGGRVWLVNHDRNANTDDRIEEMINDHGDVFERVVLSSRADATSIPQRGVRADLWNTNANGVVAYEVH